MADEDEFVEGAEDEAEDAPQVDSTGISSLRKQYKNMSNENAALKMQLEALLTRQRTIDLTEVVKRKNLPPKIIDVIPDNVDVGDVEQWLDDHADIFKPTQAARRSKPPTPEQAAAARDTQHRMDQLENSSQLTSGEQAQIAEIDAAFGNWKTVDEMRNWYHEKGAW